MTTTAIALPQGSIALRIRVFGPAEEELAATVAPPWPRWMRRLYELHSLQSADVDVISGEVGVSAALAALHLRISERLKTVGFIAARLEEMGWELEPSGPDLIAHRVTTAQMAREALEAHHLVSALMVVGDVDDRGRIRLYRPEDLRTGEAR
jgi:hypothetical protein